ncbi:MAG: DUF3995 domain-containing protein [Nibricoccus sp.]
MLTLEFTAAATTAATLGIIASVHLYWALGGRAGLAVALPSKPGDNQPLFKPGRLATLLVAFALGLAAWIILSTPDTSPLLTPWPHRHNRLLTLILALVFALRTVGDFRYVGLTKRIHETPFARADTCYYTPLCALLATACACIAW